MSYTPDQIKDLMYFRQLFYSKVGQLCRERKVLLQHMGGEQGISNMVLDDAGVRLSEMSDLAERLQANGADEYKTYMQFSSALSCGVCFLLLSLPSCCCFVRLQLETLELKLHTSDDL